MLDARFSSATTDDAPRPPAPIPASSTPTSSPPMPYSALAKTDLKPSPRPPSSSPSSSCIAINTSLSSIPLPMHTAHLPLPALSCPCCSDRQRVRLLRRLIASLVLYFCNQFYSPCPQSLAPFLLFLLLPALLLLPPLLLLSLSHSFLSLPSCKPYWTNDIGHWTNDISHSTNDISHSTNDISHSTNDIGSALVWWTRWVLVGCSKRTRVLPE